ncbi:GH3 family domain-containing protein [Opitutus terrae]|uniref:GH3 auxin-responsive promoter n=1 Tax=Opitutus terrae (strain DSM 11246 / JCM 15787 / PB90-1) TaxID=452637 RepID=B1ZRU2_OPITP|nr:GH3 auxin-responsive promoter family protein [Opitutus terrae]ACB73785.1 GH3 auxin-responsive promoter [Opitutus terrae PB90-1]
MAVLPKSLFVLGTSFQTALASRRIKQKGAMERAQQQQTFRRLLPKLAATQFGRDTGLEPGLDYEKFRARVPLRSYEQLAPWIDRMVRGEADVLWPGRCALYVLTSGTTTGQPRRLPVSEEMLTHFRAATRAAMLCYTSRVGHAGVLRGRHLLLSGSTELTPLTTPPVPPAFGGDLATMLTLSLPRWAEQHLYEPGSELARQPDSAEKIAAIIARTRRLDLSLVAGRPPRLLEFAEALAEQRTGTEPATLQSLWPNLECLVLGGTVLSPYHDALRRAAGAGVRFHEVYAAAEGMFAAQDGEPALGLRLLADLGLFFEFLPLALYDESLPAGLGARALPLHEVRAGEDYVLLLTTPGGLCRYVCGDIVRFLSTEPPRLVFAGRTRTQLTAFGEHVAERDLTEALVSICQKHAWSITHFHVAPLFLPSRTGTSRGGHEWWVELRPGTVATPTGPILAGHLDQELCSRHEGYRAKRRSGAMEAPVVRLVMPGFFAHWLQHHAARLSATEVPRSRSDRRIADNLTALACFNPD